MPSTCADFFKTPQGRTIWLWVKNHPKSPTLALPFFSDIRMLQNDPTLGPEIDAKQKKRWFDWHALADPGV